MRWRPPPADLPGTKVNQRCTKMWETRLALIYGSQMICIYSYVLIVFLYRIDVLEMVKLSQIVYRIP